MSISIIAYSGQTSPWTTLDSPTMSNRLYPHRAAGYIENWQRTCCSESCRASITQICIGSSHHMAVTVRPSLDHGTKGTQALQTILRVRLQPTLVADSGHTYCSEPIPAELTDIEHTFISTAQHQFSISVFLFKTWFLTCSTIWLNYIFKFFFYFYFLFYFL